MPHPVCSAKLCHVHPASSLTPERRGLWAARLRTMCPFWVWKGWSCTGIGGPPWTYPPDVMGSACASGLSTVWTWHVLHCLPYNINNVPCRASIFPMPEIIPTRSSTADPCRMEIFKSGGVIWLYATHEGEHWMRYGCGKEIKMQRTPGSHEFHGFWAVPPIFKLFSTPFETTRANLGAQKVVLHVSHPREHCMSAAGSVMDRTFQPVTGSCPAGLPAARMSVRLVNISATFCLCH